MKAIQAYRFALDLSPRQVRAVLAHAGAVRFAYNWALARVKAVADQRAAERSYDVPDEQLTPAGSWSLSALRKAWNVAKHEVAPWWRECSKEAFNTGLDALVHGLSNWADSRSGKRVGRRVGFPRFKSRRRSTASVRFTTGAIGAVKTKLALSERNYACEACGMVLDRDLNAARNLAALAAQTTTAGSGPVAGRGADHKTRPGGQVAAKRQPGTPPADKTGTVPPQGGTTDRVLARAHRMVTGHACGHG